MSEKKPLVAIDIKKNKVKSCGTAYYRITPEFKEFLELCRKKHGIIGFEYNGSLNFGVILEKKAGVQRPSKKKLRS